MGTHRTQIMRVGEGDMAVHDDGIVSKPGARKTKHGASRGGGSRM